MKIVIDPDRCIMAGECVYNHPELFAFGDDDGVPLVLVEELDTDELELGARQAVEVCPGGAISVTGSRP